jgi:uncharacterized protein YwqG
MQISDSPLAEAGRRAFKPGDAQTWVGLLRPAFHLKSLAQGGQPLVGYLGGNPLMPQDLEWPVWEGHGPLTFVAALDCGEIPGGRLDIPFPDSGILLFFYFNGVGEDAVQYLDPESVVNGTRVVYVPEDSADVAPRDTPEGVGSFTRILMGGEVIATAPDNENPALKAAFGDPASADPYTEYPTTDDGETFYTDLTAYRRDHSPHHQIGGYALPKAGAVEREGAYVLAPGEDEAARAAQTAQQDELVLLLQIDSDARSAMQWGDTGRLYWLIRRDDLAARRFDQAVFTWQTE